MDIIDLRKPFNTTASVKALGGKTSRMLKRSQMYTQFSLTLTLMSKFKVGTLKTTKMTLKIDYSPSQS